VSPALAAFLNAGDIASVVAAACFMTILLPWSYLLGAFQGSMRFTEFGLLTFAHAAMRILALAILLIDRSPGSVLWAAAAAALPPLAWGLWLYLRGAAERLPSQGRIVRTPVLIDRRVGPAILVAVTVGFPSLGDVVLVRHVYNADTAGLYAGMALTGRVVLFLAIAIITVLFPAFVAATPRERQDRLRQGLAAILLLTVSAAVMVSLLSTAELAVVLGSGYGAAATLVPYYATAAVFYSVASLYAFYHLALADKRYLVLIVVPFLLLQIAAPLVIASDIRLLVVVNLAISVGFALVSIVATRSRQRPTVGAAG
jgi:O-antigen/teichoic acid export membrane protein